MALDVVTYVLCKNYTNAEIERVIAGLGEGMRFKGNVPNVEALPATASNGDMYLVDDKKCKAVRYNSNWLLYDFQITKTSQLTNDTGFINTTDDVIPGPAVLVNADTLDNKLPEYYSHVEVSNTGTATEEVQYIKINGVEKKLAGGGSGGSYVAGDGITITGNEIKVTPNKFMERKAETTPNRLMAFQDNTGLIKEIPVVWDSELGKLTTSEFNATTVGGGEGKITASKLSDGVTNKTINVSEIATTSDMAGKQDKLTAGENITIDENNVISASGGGSSVAFDNKTIVKGQGNKYQTAVGGWLEIGSLIFEGEGTSDGTLPSLVLSNSLQKAITSTDVISLEVLSPVGTLEGRYGVAQRSGTLFLELDGILERYTLSFEDGAIGKQVTLAKSDGNLAAGSYEVTFKDVTEIYHPIDNKFLKLDSQTMAVNSDGELTCISRGTEVEGNVEITGDEDELISLKIGDKVYQNLNYHPFPDAFVVNKTLKEFGQSIVNYAGFATGCTWFGGIECTDLPGNMMQCECKVTAIRDKISWARNIAVVEIYSSEVAPFYWHYNTDSWNGGTGIDDWKLVASIDESKFPTTAAVGDSYNVKVKKVSAPAGSYGWEFYTEQGGGGGEPAEYLLSAEVDSNNNLKINNKNGQEVVNCSVNYTLDNAKVKAVLTEAEKETLLSGVTGTTWIAAQSNISTLQNGKQDKLTAGENITIVDNVISAIGGSGEPVAYIKDATVANEKLTLTKKDASTVELDVSGKVDKPNEPVAGQGLNVPYYFDVNYGADKVTVKDYTVDLLDKTKDPKQFNIDINCATQTNAGLLSAADKKKIDDGELPQDPTDVDAEYVLATKYVDGVWVKYWKEIANKSDIVDRGTVDYMIIKS